MQSLQARGASRRLRGQERRLRLAAAQSGVDQRRSKPRVQWEEVNLRRTWDGDDVVVKEEGKTVSKTWIASPANEEPRGVVHLVGGAFFGAMCREIYGLIAERVAREGFVVVATPYRLTTQPA